MWEEWVVKVYVPSTLLSVLWSNSTYGAAVVLVWGRCVELKHVLSGTFVNVRMS